VALVDFDVHTSIHGVGLSMNLAEDVVSIREKWMASSWWDENNVIASFYVKTPAMQI
jgi:hypothetical protein